MNEITQSQNVRIGHRSSLARELVRPFLDDVYSVSRPKRRSATLVGITLIQAASALFTMAIDRPETCSRPQQSDPVRDREQSAPVAPTMPVGNSRLENPLARPVIEE